MKAYFQKRDRVPS